MNFLKRGLTSIYRQPIKAGIFLIVVCLLAVLTSGAILVRQTILNTDQNLRRRMPAIATVEYNFDYEAALMIQEETGEWPDWSFEFLTADMIRKIGSFPQVQIFDYSIALGFGVTAQGLTLWQNPDWDSQMGYDQDLGVELSIEGVSTPYFLDAREGFVELIDGRSFNEEEMYYSHDVFPVLIASGFAEANGFSVGSLFDVQVVVFDQIALGGGGYIEDRDSPPLVEIAFPLEVIGIFDPIMPSLSESADYNAVADARFRQSQINHRIYVPNMLSEIMFNTLTEVPWRHSDITFQNFFMLNDPLEFDDFAREVENMEGNWRAMDFSRGFRTISASMENLQEVADLIFFMAIGATLLIISLLVLLFLHDRRHEMGVYLALGEKRKKIVMQMLIELIPLAFVGMTLALFAGNMLASSLSRELLKQGMTQPLKTSGLQESHILEEFGYRFELTHEEMLESYEIRIDAGSVILFYVVGLGATLIATVIPTLHATNINPKKLLM